MLRFALVALCALWLLPFAACRIYADTDLEGTWCTGSCDVVTGPVGGNDRPVRPGRSHIAGVL